MKRFVFMLCALVTLVSCCLYCINARAYDTNGRLYDSRGFSFSINRADPDADESGTDVDSVIPIDTKVLYGVPLEKLVYKVYSGSYFAYLENTHKPHYLPQLDFIKVSMGELVKSVSADILIPIYGFARPINTIYVPDEVLFFVSVGSKADEELFALSEKSGFIEYCGVKLKDVSVIARYEEGEGDCALALYSLKLCKAEDTRALARLLNSHAFESSKNAALYADLGYSALQSYYLDAVDMPYELVTSEDTLIIGADSRYSHYADVKAVLSGSASELCGHAVESAEEICTAEGYTVCRIRLGAGVDAEAAIANMQAVGMAAEYAAYELQDVTAGDANGDGVIDNLDAATVLMIDAGLAEADGVLGDANGDGKVNNLDAALILQYDAGLISGF